MNHQQYLTLVVLGLSFLLTHCGGDSKDSAATSNSCDTSQASVAAATYSELWDNVFKSQCGSCHGPGTDTKTVGGPDMRTKDKFHSELVEKTGNDYPEWDTYQKNRADCLDFNFIKSGSSKDSVVTAVLDDSIKLSGCTIKSHIDAPQSVCLTASNKSKLKEWIDDGAKE